LIQKHLLYTKSSENEIFIDVQRTDTTSSVFV